MNGVPEPASGRAPTLTVLSGGAMRGVMEEAAPLFERSHGTKTQIRFGLTSTLAEDIENGAAFDVAILPRPEIDALAQRGKIAAGSAIDVARSAIGVAVRAGASKPAIDTVAAFTRTLREARSIVYSDGPSGLYIAGMIERLGLAAAMRPKTKFTTGPVAELVARGEAEIGLQQIVAILPVKGAELAGPLPDELQNIIVYAAAASAAATTSQSASAFLTFLGSTDARRIVRSKGMEPG